MTDWIPGMFYDVGGAAALFWPDQHPEHPDPALAQRWIVFDPWGGLVPFLTPQDPEEAARALWAEIRSTPVEAALFELMLANPEDAVVDQHGTLLNVEEI